MQRRWTVGFESEWPSSGLDSWLVGSFSFFSLGTHRSPNTKKEHKVNDKYICVYVDLQKGINKVPAELKPRLWLTEIPKATTMPKPGSLLPESGLLCVLISESFFSLTIVIKYVMFDVSEIVNCFDEMQWLILID